MLSQLFLSSAFAVVGLGLHIPRVWGEMTYMYTRPGTQAFLFRTAVMLLGVSRARMSVSKMYEVVAHEARLLLSIRSCYISTSGVKELNL